MSGIRIITVIKSLFAYQTHQIFLFQFSDPPQESEPLTVGKVEEGQSESCEPKPDSPPVISEKRKQQRTSSSQFLSQDEVFVNLDDSKIEEIDDQDLPTSTQSDQTGSEPPVLAR